MKEAMGNMGILIIAILFIILFGSFLSVSVNYSKAFKVKDEIINIIERNKGFSPINGSQRSTLEEIYAYMAEVGYRTTGSCDGVQMEADWVGYNSNSYAETYRNPMICIKTVSVSSGSIEVPDSAYYKVKVFYEMDLPIINRFFHFQIEGTTKQILFPAG